MAQYNAWRVYTNNQNVTRFCVGTAVGVFGAWNYAEKGIVYRFSNDTIKGMQKANIWPSQWNLPKAETIRKQLNDSFVLRTGVGNNQVSWIGAAFSHKDFAHLLFNMLSWTSCGAMLYHLPTRHYAALILGSALSASGMFVYDHQGRPGSGLGSSGIVSGILATSTMFFPTARISLLGVIPMPLWVATGAYFMADTYFMRNGIETGIGHSAHVGGALWGVAYYALFLRRYGGILGPRRY